MSIPFEEARRLVLERIAPLPPEEVPLLEALGRALAEPLVANRNLPLFDNSAMDGFALRAADCEGGAELRISGFLPAGARAEEALEPGCAVRIMTGAPLPAGADAVVPVEDAVCSGAGVRPAGPVKSGDHIRFSGQDIRQGELVAEEGSLLRPAEINLLASFGIDRVRVRRRPKVAILSTGDELVELGEPLGSDRIVNSNAWSLAAQVKEAGGEPVMLGIARDELEPLRQKLSEGLGFDALITSAGVSAGDRDFVREALSSLGVESVFWKVAMKPGGPTAFGVKGAVPVFSLPGNPVSTMITFEQFVRPALLGMMGHRSLLRATLKASLAQAVRKKPGKTQFMRVALEVENGRLQVRSSGNQDTGILKTMIRADAIAVLEASRGGYAAGEEVEIELLGTPMC